jgi:hypothetical protein
MIRANGQLNHQPPDTWTCYTPEGAAGAGHSNEVQGPWDAAYAIDLYINDGGVSSLGHRRWILDPPFLPTALGQTDGWNCTYVMTGGNSYRPPYLAFPSPGPFPVQALTGPWSLGCGSYDQAQTRVTFKDQATGAEEQLTPGFLDGMYGSYGAYLSFQPTLPVAAGHDFQVSISNVSWDGQPAPATLTYTTRIVDCSP